MSRIHDSSSEVFSGKRFEGEDLLWLRVAMRVSNPQWIADLLAPYAKSKKRVSIVVSAVDFSVPVVVGDLIDAVAAGRDQWVHVDLTLRYIRELGGYRE